MQKDTIVITGIARTPQGNLLGCFKEMTAPQLGAVAIQAAVTRAGIAADKIDAVIMGCVLPAGQGQAPARQAALAAHLPISTPCMTINKMCGSGMQAIMLAHDNLLAGSANIIVAGGMESMTQAPYLLPKARQGYRLGQGEVLDHLMVDGLEDAYEKHKPMGYFAEQCAKIYGFTREQQDVYAKTSLERAQQAIQEKNFVAEIAPVTIKDRAGEKIIASDEHPLSVKLEKIPQLSPIFMPEGTITAANSSSIADGAAAVVLTTLAQAKKHGMRPLAKVIAHTSFATLPHQFPTAPIDAIKRLLQKINWPVAEVDLFEINEAFAVVTMAALRDLKIPHAKLNIHGGGCALGHPIGATGARIVVTLVAALEKYNLRRGIAALCIGGGEATAVAIERL